MPDTAETIAGELCAAAWRLKRAEELARPIDAKDAQETHRMIVQAKEKEIKWRGRVSREPRHD